MSDRALDESVDLKIIPEQIPEAMIKVGEEAKPTELKPPPTESDLSVVPMPEATVEVEEKAKQQAEDVGDDIPVATSSETFSMEGIPPNIVVPGPTNLLPPPEKKDLPGVDDKKSDEELGELDNEEKTVRELIDEILRDPVTQVLIRMNQMHPTVVVCNIGITVDIGRLGVPGPSKTPLPASQIGLAKAKVDKEDTGIKAEKDADKDRKEKPEKEPEGESKLKN